MTDALTFTFKSRQASGVLWYRCELCPVDVHVAMLTDHAAVAHGRVAWRIEQL